MLNVKAAVYNLKSLINLDLCAYGEMSAEKNNVALNHSLNSFICPFHTYPIKLTFHIFIKNPLLPFQSVCVCVLKDHLLIILTKSYIFFKSAFHKMWAAGPCAVYQEYILPILMLVWL